MAILEREIVMPQATEHPHIDRVPGFCGGRPKIKGTRIPVSTIAAFHNQSVGAVALREDYPQLTLAEIHDAISYYYDHQQEIDADIDESRRREEAAS